VIRVPAAPGCPDAVFIEDTAVVLPEIAVVTRPGAPSRRGETAAVAASLAAYREIRTVEAPGTLDGGDVLVVGRRAFVGQSARTNAEGIAQLRRLLAPFGYGVDGVRMAGCLHLKSAATAVDEETLLVQPAWVPPSVFAGLTIVTVDPSEPAAANALRIGGRIVYPLAFPRTAERLVTRGIELRLVDVSELAKAEGAVTCCSLVFDA
jgi:dimethylargininase